MSRALDALEKIEKYALSPGCRRTYLLRHFGETADPKTVCGKTCDYCSNPIKVQKAIEVALSPSLQTGFSSDIYHGRGLEDESSYEKVDWTVGSLGINHHAPDETSSNVEEDTKPSAKFEKASTVLAKYEVRQVSASFCRA